MNKKKEVSGQRQIERSLPGIGILTALAGSLCCIVPVLAVVAGTTGIAASFSWLDPLRPLFMGIAGLSLGFAWYRTLTLSKSNDISCACDDEEMKPKQAVIQKPSVLGAITLLTVLLFAFPSYAHLFLSDTTAEASLPAPSGSELRVVEFEITGMTCSGCSEHVRHGIQKLPGIRRIDVSHTTGMARVEFDPGLTDKDSLARTIAASGYTVTTMRELNQWK